jgi:hypothetical protein
MGAADRQQAGPVAGAHAEGKGGSGTGRADSAG